MLRKILVLVTIASFLFTNASTTSAQTEGEVCGVRSSCSTGFECVSGICRKLGQVNEDCPCVTGLTCGPQGKCLKLGGVGADCPCQTGLQCGSNGKCQNPSSGGSGSSAVPSCTDRQGVQGIPTAIGCIPYGSPEALTSFFLKWALGIGGGIALLLIIYASFVISTSSGDPRRMQGGKELLTSAVAGLMLLIFSIFILRILGVNILGIF